MASALRGGGITNIAQLQTTSIPQLIALCGGPDHMGLVQKLMSLGWGRDTTPVVAKGPPKSIQVGGAARGEGGVSYWPHVMVPTICHWPRSFMALGWGRDTLPVVAKGPLRAYRWASVCVGGYSAALLRQYSYTPCVMGVCRWVW